NSERRAETPAVEEERIAVVGQGYVGLPLTLAFGKAFPETIGFDIDEAKIGRLKAHSDTTGEAESVELQTTTVNFTSDPDALSEATFIVVAVPTPIDADRRPDLRPVMAASRSVGSVSQRGAVVVFESTVYPGVTEDICGPILEEVSG